MRFIGNNMLDEWILYNRQFQGNIWCTLVTLEATSVPSVHPTNIYSLTSLHSTSNHTISCTDTIINNYVRPVVYLSIYTVSASNIIFIDLFKCRSKHLPNFTIYLIFIFDILDTIVFYFTQALVHWLISSIRIRRNDGFSFSKSMDMRLHVINFELWRAREPI